jgi:serine/threonine protein kinase
MERDFLPNDTLLDNRYRLFERIGGGGFGITYRAQDEKLSRVIAIKELFPIGCKREMNGRVVPLGKHTSQVETITDHDFDAMKVRFEEEGRTLAGLNHPGIVKVYDTFSTNNTVYLVMEHLEGQNLVDATAQGHKPLSVPEAIRIAKALNEPLTYLHKKSLLHRDIKPGNIMRLTNGKVVLIDFGGTREFSHHQSASYSKIFTHGFTAPEQYEKRYQASPATDIYALGATIYYCLSGDIPTGSTIRLADDQLQRLDTVRPDVPRPVASAIAHAMMPRQKERTQSMADLVKELEGKPSPTEKTIDTTPAPPPAPTRSPWGAISGFGLIGAIAFIIGQNMTGKTNTPQNSEGNSSNTSSAGTTITNTTPTPFTSTPQPETGAPSDTEIEKYLIGKTIGDSWRVESQEVKSIDRVSSEKSGDTWRVVVALRLDEPNYEAKAQVEVGYKNGDFTSYATKSFSRTRKATPPPTPTPTPQPETPPATFTTNPSSTTNTGVYAHRNLGIQSFSTNGADRPLTAGEERDGASPVLVIKPSNDENYALKISELDTQSKSVLAYYEGRVGAKKDMKGLRYKQKKLTNTAEFKGLPAVSWEYTERDPEKNYTKHIIKFGVEHNGRVYEISMVGPEEGFDSFRTGSCHPIIDSLVW